MSPAPRRLYFSVAQRKLLTPNDFADLDTLEAQLLAFGRQHEQITTPADWKFPLTDLDCRTQRLELSATQATGPNTSATLRARALVYGATKHKSSRKHQHEPLERTMETMDSVSTCLAAELHRRARAHVPGGTHSNSRLRNPYPVFAARAKGAYLWDADGVEYLDLQMGNASVALGYGREEVNAAVIAAVTAGLTTGVETAAAVEAAEALAEVIPECRAVRFANTGTEALMHAVAIARHATGRELVAKAEGAYHGWYDPLWVSNWPDPGNAGTANAPATVPGSAGLSANAAKTIVVPFNDLAGTEALLRAHADEVALLAIEPVMIDIGYIPATQEYLNHLRAVTTELGILLLFDELLTGFRIAPGGARQVYGVIPDLSTYGKAIANGYPLAALEGREDLMALTNPVDGGTVGWVGTYNGHPLPVAAAAAAVPLLADGAVQAQLSALNVQLRDGFAELSSRSGIPVVAAGEGGHFQPYFVDEEPSDYRSAARTNPDRYRTWADEMAAANILVPGGPLLHCAVSVAHGSREIATVLEVSERAFAKMS